MSGGSTPGQVWQKFMNAASKAIGKDNERFDRPTAKVGDPSKKGNGLDPLPEPPPQQDCFLGGLICPPGQGNNQNPGGQNPGGQNPDPNNPGNNDPNNPGNNGGGNQGEPTQPGTLPGFPPNPNEQNQDSQDD